MGFKLRGQDISKIVQCYNNISISTTEAQSSNTLTNNSGQKSLSTQIMTSHILVI